MPDHLHFIAPIVRRARRTLAAVLGGFAKAFGLGELWMPVPEPEPLRSPDKIGRGIRYTLLNPCRPWRYGARVVQLARDPLEWPWSTARDLVGAVVAPWCNADEVAARMGLRVEGTAIAALHRFVSSDPSVRVSGTAVPEPRPPSLTPDSSLETVALAVGAALRCDPRDITRRGEPRSVFVALAKRQGHRQIRELARACGVHPDTIARAARACSSAALDAAALCLGDRRLLRGPGPMRPTSWSGANAGEPDAHGPPDVHDWPGAWSTARVG